MLVHIWKHVPETFHERLLALLNRYEITFPLKGSLNLIFPGKIFCRRGVVRFKFSAIIFPGNDCFEPQAHFLVLGSSPATSVVPCMLPAEDEMAYAKFKSEADKIKSCVDVRSFEHRVRLFQFKFLPLGFFPRLVVRLMHDEDVLYSHAWARGVILATGDKSHERVALEYDLAQQNLRVTSSKPRNKYDNG